jgi:hypothetical protein
MSEGTQSKGKEIDYPLLRVMLRIMLAGNPLAAKVWTFTVRG